MDAHAKAFWLPKDGSCEAEYDDAFFPRKSKSYRVTKRRRFAVADGATEASFSKLWANQLVASFVRDDFGVQLRPVELKPLQESWSQKVHGKALPWYAEEKLASGAFAAFVGLEIEEMSVGADTQRSWRAVAAGDSCLIHIQGNQIAKAFPLADSLSFPARPSLLASLAPMNATENGLLHTTGGSWGCDDTFLLMTDALSRWFFEESEKGNRPWNILRDLDTRGQASFTELIGDLRSRRAIKDDDVTLMRVDIIG